MVSMNEKPLPLNARLYNVVRAIEASRRRIAVVVNEEGRLLGTLTDGDVRRCLIAGGTLETLATQAMNSAPVTAEVGSPDGYLLDLMKGANILTVPLVDDEGRFAQLVHVSDLGELKEDSYTRSFATAVIMAGGEGRRLRSAVDGIPKPMVEIGGIPLIERQVRRLAKLGIERCYISVNYLSHVIEDHFEDGSAFGITIRYLRESTKMGTAGALSLLPNDIEGPVAVMNGDILTTSDLDSLYSYHVDHGAMITVAAVDYKVDIPYGVIRSEGVYAVALEEKPSQRFLCNAGIYAVSTDALALIPAGRLYNMTDLIADCLAQRRPVAVFPVHEYWSDIGTPADLEKARAVFASYDEGE